MVLRLLRPPPLLLPLLLRVQAEFQLCQPAVELQIQAQPPRPRLARERLSGEEASVRYQGRAGRRQRGQGGAGGQRAHGAGGLRQSEGLDPGRP